MDPSNQLAPHRGGLILALGILSLVLCPLAGIASWVMGKADAAEMDAGRMDPTGRGLTDAGKVLGMVALALCAISVVVALGLMIFGLVFAAAANS